MDFTQKAGTVGSELRKGQRPESKAHGIGSENGGAILMMPAGRRVPGMDFAYAIVKQLPIPAAATWLFVTLWSITRPHRGSQGSIKGVYLFDLQGQILEAAGAVMDGPAEGRLGGILQSMEEFVRKSLDRGPRGRLKSLKQEGFTIVVESGPTLVLAALVDGEPHDLLRGELREVVSMLEARPGADKGASAEVHRVLEALLRPREVF